jgi:hypothetical protein
MVLGDRIIDEVKEERNNSSIDDHLNGWIFLYTNNLPDPSHSYQSAADIL